MAVEVKGGTTFQAGVPKPLFDTHLDMRLGSNANTLYDVSNDGRFLIPVLAEPAAAVPMTVSHVRPACDT